MLISNIEELKNTPLYNKKLNKFYTGTKLEFKCDSCNSYFNAVYVLMNKLEHLCLKCRAKKNGAKSNGFRKPNKTHYKYWLNKGYSKEEATNEICKLKKNNKAYWINRGYSVEEAVIKAKEILLRSIKSKKEYWINRGYSEEEAKEKSKQYSRQSNVLCKEHWLNKGYSEEEANDKISKNIKIRNRLCKEYWFKCGYSEEEAKDKILEEEHKIHKIRNNKKMGESIHKYWISLHKDNKKYNTYINKISVSNKKHNRTHSPVFIEYWINKGYSKEEALIKRNEVRYTNNNGNISSKIEERFFKEFMEYSELSITRNKFLTSNKRNICPDGRYKNFIIELNGTKPHLDSRFYDEDDKTPWGKTFEQKHNEDLIRVNALLYNYNVYIVWEYDYLNNKDKVFNDLLEKINNETCENGKYWSSDCL